MVSSCFDRATDLLAPWSPGKATFDELVELLKTYYDPKPSKRVQHFHFNNRAQGQHESIAAYTAELRRLAQHCEF